MEQMDRPELIFRDTVGPPEIVWLGPPRRVFIHDAVSQVAKYAVDFLL
jgi:hypothetical protein